VSVLRLTATSELFSSRVSPNASRAGFRMSVPSCRWQSWCVASPSGFLSSR
jgi:hypothetical protein